MKKVFSILAVAVVATAFVACGPSAEEKAKLDEQAKHTADSIAKALESSLNTAMDQAAATADSAAKATETNTTAAPATTEAHK